MSKLAIKRRTYNEFYFTYSQVRKIPRINIGDTFEYEGQVFTVKQAYMKANDNDSYGFLVITE